MTVLIKGKGPVVHLDRRNKAQMIEAIISDFSGSSVRDKKILDIGAGNGQISEYFHPNNRQYAFDIGDFRTQKESGVKFVIGRSENLPFKKDCYDIVLSHHVIEHVDNQLLHLEEIHRVLKPDGFCYLATPNKSSPFMAGHRGNNQVLRFHMMKPLFERSGFKAIEYYSKIVHSPYKFNYEVKFGRLVPMAILEKLKIFFPSQCFILSPEE